LKSDSKELEDRLRYFPSFPTSPVTQEASMAKGSSLVQSQMR
jgi:hypothetical protein